MTNQKTLSDRYAQKQKLNTTKKKLNEISRKRLNEEIDQKLLKAVIDTVKKLQAINFGKLEILDQARDAAVLDATKIASSTDKPGFMNRIASMFRDNKNPLYDALAFGSAISNFFPMLSQYAEAISAKGGAEVDGSKTLFQISSNEMDPAIKNLISKGLRPNGALAKLGAGWAKKYLKGSIDDLVSQIMDASIDELKQISVSVKQSTTNIKQVSQAAEQKSQTGETKGEESGDMKGTYLKIKNDLGDIDDSQRKTVATVLTALKKHDLLK